MNSAREREGSRDRPRLSGLELIGLGWGVCTKVRGLQLMNGW